LSLTLKSSVSLLLPGVRRDLSGNLFRAMSEKADCYNSKSLQWTSCSPTPTPWI